LLVLSVSSCSGKVVYAPAATDFFSQVCEASILTKADKIRRLGWKPKVGPLTDSVQHAFTAQQSAAK